jgi:hypothetical protein
MRQWHKFTQHTLVRVCPAPARLPPGVPHIRRELEMPAAALHHAGVHARQLELLETALREVSSSTASGAIQDRLWLNVFFQQRRR